MARSTERPKPGLIDPTRVGDPTAVSRETRLTTDWGTVKKGDPSVFVAKLLQKRGFKIELLPTPADYFASVIIRPSSAEAQETFLLICGILEMRVLQQAVNPGHWGLNQPDFNGITVPILQDPETQERIKALHLNNVASYWDHAADEVIREYHGTRYQNCLRKRNNAEFERDRLLNRGKRTLPSQQEVDDWIQTVVDTKLPALTPAAAAPVAAA